MITPHMGTLLQFITNPLSLAMQVRVSARRQTNLGIRGDTVIVDQPLQGRLVAPIHRCPILSPQ